MSSGARFAQADAVAQKGAAVSAGDFDEFLEPFFLVLIEDWVYARLVLKPFRIAHFLAAEQLVQRADID